MRDVEVYLDDRPGALAELGEVLGRAGVSLEGGGVFRHGGVGVAHFLVDDGERARTALLDAGLDVRVVSEVVLLRLDQELPGQLGALTRRMAEAGVNLTAQYSDHANQLVLVVDDAHREAAHEVAASWPTP